MFYGDEGEITIEVSGTHHLPHLQFPVAGGDSPRLASSLSPAMSHWPCMRERER